MQRKMSLGGVFLLFLLFCAISSYIELDKATTTETIPFAEEIIPYTEETVATTEETIPPAENTISSTNTISPTRNTTTCIAVIDGDTFLLSNGETVRLIGIDAPELSQPGGDKSRKYLTQLLLNKGVILKTGREDRDKYNRLLRFVYRGSTCINEEMIKQGYAEARYLTSNDQIREHYIKLEIEAETAKAGLWRDNIFQPRSNLRWEDDIPVIDWFDAHNYYNQYVIIRGTIVKTYNSGIVCFLNFDSNYQYFTAVIFASDFLGFPFIPEAFYLRKKVYIIGIIKEYKGSPEIIVKTPDQIRIRA